MDEEKKLTYRIRPGHTFGFPEKQAGETVELTEKEAASFLDKLELVETPAPRVPKPAAKE